MKSHKSDICNFDVHRAYYVKRLKGKKHMEIVKENEMMIPE